jgi:GntP family gluconate:H+ symporter
VSLAPIALTDTTVLSDAGDTQLLLAAVAGILTVVLTIVWAKFHPLLGLILGTVVLAAVAMVPPADALDSFVTGLGSSEGGM